MAPSQRLEPVFGPVPAAVGGVTGVTPRPVAGHDHGVAAWVGLALAAALLALPGLLAPVSTPQGPAVAAPASPFSPGRTRLADDDEVLFGLFSLKIAGGSSADELWRRWNDLRQRQLGLFDDQRPLVRPVGGPNGGFMLLVGEYRNAATAAEACGTLRARFLSCEIVQRSGTQGPAVLPPGSSP